MGIPTTRVRVHGNIARIEVDREYFEKILENKDTILKIKDLGFSYVTLDLNGLTSGTFDKN